MINPLHAATPGIPQEPSPYFPSSRRFLNPLYLRVEAVPGAADAGVDLERLAASARALGAERRIDRDRVYRLKIDALERLWARFGGDPAFEHYSSARGEPLAEFATFCALAERHGRDWRRWPAGYRHPTRPPVARFRMEQAGRVHFHQWLQWLADGQLGRAARELPVMQDLPIAFDPGGADAWTWQEALAGDVTLGAPPDLYNTRGQDWGVPPFVPHRLTAVAYEPFIQTIRASLRHAAGLRIDHAPGLFRLFWIPEGIDPADGAFVRYPADDLLAIVALESQRAGAFVVGEDLGTVDPDMRERLGAAGVLSYRLLWFEDAAPARYPERALAAVTTHDLPTVAGLWTGADLQAQEALGLQPNARGMREIRDRLRRITGLPDDAGPERVIERAYLLLGEAPSALVAATLDDACATRERPNMPQTTTEWPNWSLALPRTLDQLESDPLPRVVARALGTRDQPRD